MNPIEELKTEHRGIESALIILQSIADRLVAGQDAAVTHDAETLLDFFRTFVDTCHHGKEEHGLFPELERAGVSRKGGPIGVMLSEHEEGRGHIRAMTRALKEGPAAGDFQRHAAAYSELLRRHIEKEDQVLFQIAAQRLSESQQDQLEEQFERIEREVVGAGKHEQYHAMLETFIHKYGQAH